MSKKLWMNTAENEIYDHKVYEKFSVHWLMQITLTMKFQNEKQAKKTLQAFTKRRKLSKLTYEASIILISKPLKNSMNKRKLQAKFLMNIGGEILKSILAT